MKKYKYLVYKYLVNICSSKKWRTGSASKGKSQERDSDNRVDMRNKEKEIWRKLGKKDVIVRCVGMDRNRIWSKSLEMERKGDSAIQGEKMQERYIR